MALWQFFTAHWYFIIYLNKKKKGVENKSPIMESKRKRVGENQLSYCRHKWVYTLYKAHNPDKNNTLVYLYMYKHKRSKTQQQRPLDKILF